MPGMAVSPRRKPIWSAWHGNIPIMPTPGWPWGTSISGGSGSATRVLIARGQTFINRRWGFTISGNLQRTPDYQQRGLSMGVISRW